jgi:hypothetical protein
MIAKLEQEMQKIDNVMLPYWDWGYDSQSPENAPIWGKDSLTFGSNRNNSTRCVTDGAFAGRTTMYPTAHCLQRQWERVNEMSALIPTFELQRILTTRREYSGYREDIEATHAILHLAIGGDMQSPAESPNDPVFYLHHANVDRLWWKWQLAYPNLARTYAGSSLVNNRVTGTAAASDMLTPYKVRVSDVFKVEDLCYTYKEVNLNSLKPELPPPTVRENNGQQRQKTNDRLVKVNPAPGRDKISSIDRSDLLCIRVPKPLTETCIRANGMNREKVRARERQYAEEVKKLNEKGTVVDGALWTRPGVLAKLIRGGTTKFHADVKGVRVEVKVNQQQPLQAVSDLKERVKLTLKKEGINAKLPKT